MDPLWDGARLGVILVHAETYCSQYSQPYSLGDTGDVDSDYQPTVASCFLLHEID